MQCPMMATAMYGFLKNLPRFFSLRRPAVPDRSYAVGRFWTAAGVEMRGPGSLRGPGNLGSDTEGQRTPHAPQIDSRLCTSVN